MNVYPGTRIMRFSESNGLGLQLLSFLPKQGYFCGPNGSEQYCGSDTRFGSGSARMLIWSGSDLTFLSSEKKRKSKRKSYQPIKRRKRGTIK